MYRVSLSALAVAASVVAVAALSAAASGSLPRGATPSGWRSSAIMFESATPGKGYELNTVDLRGTIRPVTANSPAQPDYATGWALSPDGRSVAVNSYAKLNAVAVEPKLVGVDMYPSSWSPDGRQIVGNEFDSLDIVAVDLRTQRATTIYEPADGYGPPDPLGLDPAWSPKGAVIAMTLQYSSDDGMTTWRGIGLMSVTSHRFMATPREWVTSLRDLEGPAWSPDARKIAFQARVKTQPATAPRSIYVAAIGTGQRPRLVVRNGHSPSWSPDGKKIAFVRNVTRTNSEIFVVNADGTGMRRLTVSAGKDSRPVWLPSPRN